MSLTETLREDELGGARENADDKRAAIKTTRSAHARDSRVVARRDISSILSAANYEKRSASRERVFVPRSRSVKRPTCRVVDPRVILVRV
jgi:hypothetical protein